MGCLAFEFWGFLPIAANDNSTGTVLRKYVHSTRDDDPQVWLEGAGNSDIRYVYSNYQGSVVATTNAAGSTVQLYKYDPYGIPKDASNNDSWQGFRFRYTGQQIIPEAKLYYYKARVYDPNLGIFLQTDPIGTKDDLNLYAYVKEDPVNGTDPSGLIGCDSTISMSQCSELDQLQERALEDVAKVQDYVSQLEKEKAEIDSGKRRNLTDETKAVEEAIVKYFGNSNKKTISALRKNLNYTTLALKDDYSFKFSNDIIPGFYAKSFFGVSTVRLGDAFWKSTGTQKVNTIIHEAGHLGGLNIFPPLWEAYGEKSIGLPNWYALRNADTLSNFVQALTH